MRDAAVWDLVPGSPDGAYRAALGLLDELLLSVGDVVSILCRIA